MQIRWSRAGGLHQVPHYEVFSCAGRAFKARPSFHVRRLLLWRSLAIDGRSGTRVRKALARFPVGWRCRTTVRFQAGCIPSWRGSCGSYSLSPVAAVSRWLLPLL
jgi:hypothetical protein